MNAIQKITVAGLRSLRDVTLEPGRITVLIGANGSGKSNLLSLFRLLAAVRTRSLALHVGREGGSSTLLYRGEQITREIVLRVQSGHGAYAIVYGGTLGTSAGGQLVFVDEFAAETVGPDGAWGRGPALGAGHMESRLPDVPRESTAHRALEMLRGFAYYHFHDTSPTSPLRSNARAIEHRRLLSDGANLAAYLLFLKQSEDLKAQVAWRRLTGLLRQVAPFIRELVPTPVNADPETFRLEDPTGRIDNVTVRLDWIDDEGTRFAMHQLSDGTVRAIALFAALTQPSSTLPSLICIDEPELGLHPAALALLASLVDSISSHCQVLLATQSPALLDHFRPEDVVVAERVRGATELRRLPVDDLRGWLEDYRLSELFDKNVLGGRP